VTDKQVTFYEKQINETKELMIEAQDKLTRFRQANINQLPEAQSEHQARLAKRRDEVQMTQQALVGARQALGIAEDKLSEMEPEIVSETREITNPVAQQLRAQERNLNMQLELLMKDYTPDHWKVIDIRKQHDLVVDQLTSFSQTRSSEETRIPNPQYQSLQEKITDFHLQISSLERSIQQQQDDIRTLEEYLNAIPDVQKDLVKLEGDYNEARQRSVYYQSQLDRAKLASEVESQGQGPSFEIQDPARLPTKPSSPNRMKIAVFSLMAGLMLSGGLVFVVNFFDRSVRNLREARVAIQMPLLGVIQQIVTPQELARRRRLRILTVTSVMLALVMIAAAGYLMREPLRGQIEMLRQTIQGL
jgi:uncharacterized protein involved in exopolysaccharide biosynthesis